VTRQIDGVLALDIADGTRRLDKVLLFDLEVGLIPGYIAGVLVVPACENSADTAKSDGILEPE
jgi:hypothetical protein